MVELAQLQLHNFFEFVNKVPWAHLDIAGTATGMPKTSTNTSWATGFGVHLLDTFVKKFYEK